MSDRPIAGQFETVGDDRVLGVNYSLLLGAVLATLTLCVAVVVLVARRAH